MILWTDDLETSSGREARWFDIEMLSKLYSGIDKDLASGYFITQSQNSVVFVYFLLNPKRFVTFADIIIN